MNVKGVGGVCHGENTRLNGTKSPSLIMEDSSDGCEVAGFVFSSNFDSGNLGRVELVPKVTGKSYRTFFTYSLCNYL